jgi:hypothetical protein
MKRFFCTICGRVKRVRKYPIDITSVHSDNVLARVGTCSKHTEELMQGKSAQMMSFKSDVPVMIIAKSKRRA